MLAFLLVEPLLYGLAAAFLVGAVLAHLFGMRSTHRAEQETFARPASQSPEDELRELGIVEIKPKERIGKSAPAAGPNGLAEAAAEAEPAVRKRPHESSEAAPKSLAWRNKEVIMPYLNSLQGAIEAHTVCLLRRDPDARRYHIEAVVSRNAYARSQGHFSAAEPLMLAESAGTQVVSHRVGERGISPQSLGYYIEPIAVRQVLMTLVPHREDGEVYVLLADSMEEGGLGSTRKQSLLSQFAGLLRSVLEAHAEEAAPDGSPEAPAPRPRREIIAEEMEKARAEGVPLGLGLVYLCRAEEVAAEGAQAVAAAEEQLERQLQQALPPEARMDRFGELTYGLFFNADAAEIELWALELKSGLDAGEGALQGGVAVGIAMMREEHHHPEDLRSDAYAALQESFESAGKYITII